MTFWSRVFFLFLLVRKGALVLEWKVGPSYRQQWFDGQWWYWAWIDQLGALASCWRYKKCYCSIKGKGDWKSLQSAGLESSLDWPIGWVSFKSSPSLTITDACRTHSISFMRKESVITIVNVCCRVKEWTLSRGSLAWTMCETGRWAMQLVKGQEDASRD